MLRLSPTTITLTMFEVQAYDCQNRWADRLGMECDLRLRMSSLRVTSAPSSENPFSDIIRATEVDDAPTGNTEGMDKNTSSELPSPSPQKPARAEQPEEKCSSHMSRGPSAMLSPIPTASRAEVVSEESRVPTEIPCPDSTESRTAPGQATDEYFPTIVRCLKPC